MQEALKSISEADRERKRSKSGKRWVLPRNSVGLCLSAQQFTFHVAVRPGVGGGVPFIAI